MLHKEIAVLDTLPLPEDLGAEQAVLGAILREPDSMDEATAQLQGGEFSDLSNRRIYQVMRELYEDGTPIEVLPIVNRLKEKGWLESNSVTFISKLASSVPTAANIAYYIGEVQKNHVHRQLIINLRETLIEAYQTHDPSKLISTAQAKMDELAEQSIAPNTFSSIRDILPECFEDLDKKYHARSEGRTFGVPSGFVDLDRMTSGFQDGDLIIVGARPSVGKTAFALNVAQNAAVEVENVIAIFSLEMSKKQLVNRMICAEGNVNASDFRSGYLIQDDWGRVTNAIGKLSERQIYIDDTPAITAMEILSKCRRLKKEKGLSMIIIDYLQLISGGGRSENRTQEVSDISRTLKRIARELGVPVIALSQLSRGVEQRQDKRPMLSDLRESGSIEQDADVITFLYRDDYYDNDSEKKGTIEVIIAKQRNGPVGTVELAFLKDFNKFVSLNRTTESTQTGAKVPDMHRRS